jgi:CRISPR-associated endonuclease Csn1
MVRDHVYTAKVNGIALADALREFKDNEKVRSPHIKHGVRHVRLLKPEQQEYLVPIRDRKNGRPYKAYSAGENFCIEIFEKSEGRWDGEAVRRFDANHDDYRPGWHKGNPGSRLVMRVHKGDLLRVEHDGGRKIMVVHRLDAAAGRLKLAAHNETGKLDRRHATDNDVDPFRWLMASYNTLKAMKAERVRVDELGRVWRLRPEDVARDL